MAHENTLSNIIAGDFEDQPFFNENGGVYIPGKSYGKEKKYEVVNAFVTLAFQTGSTPSLRKIADTVRVSHVYVKKVLDETKTNSIFGDPRATLFEKKKIGDMLTAEEEMFLLSLHACDATRPNSSYQRELFLTYGTLVSRSFVTNWFSKRFDFKGHFRKPNLIPLDKFKEENMQRFCEFEDKIASLPDHRKFHWCDEKHLVNSDVFQQKVRADPRSGRVGFIAVPGTFREAYNLMAIINGDVSRAFPVDFTISKENGDSNAFVAFILYLIQKRWFRHHDVLIMDNAAIHTGGAADIVEELLWKSVVDGRELNVLVVYLPTRSPELNPIELIFHVLSRRVRSWRCQSPQNLVLSEDAVVKETCRILSSMDFQLIGKCIGHCGY